MDYWVSGAPLLSDYMQRDADSAAKDARRGDDLFIDSEVNKSPDLFYPQRCFEYNNIKS